MTATVVTDNFIEIERKFLIADIDPEQLPDHRKTVIQQVFLSTRDPSMDRRIRKEERDEEVRYFLVEKYRTSKPVIRFNRKEQISRQRFETLMGRTDPGREPEKKSRFEFFWNSQRFRIDQYEGPTAGLLVLEAVLNDEKEKIEIPEFCKVIREVTEDRSYFFHRPEAAAGHRVKHPPVRRNTASFYIVTIIDLLGQGAQLERFSGIPSMPKEKRAFDRLAQRTFETVRRFRERIRLLHEDLPLDHKVPSFVKERLTPKQFALLRRNMGPSIGYQFFTDLAMLKINLSGQRAYRPLLSLYSLFHRLGLLFLTQLAEGVLIRGAVDVGICTEFDHGDLYGQAVGRAYALESRTAVYPRVLIGSNLVEYVDSFRDMRVSSDEKTIIACYSELIRGCLKEDADGMTILSYLSPVLRKSYFAGENEFRYVTKAACRFIDNREWSSADGGEQLDRRLSRLSDYFRAEGCWPETGKG
jgi:CYTH domain-containing protein